MYNSILADVLEKGVVGGCFMYLLYMFVHKFSKTQDDIAHTLEDISHTMERMDERMGKLEERVYHLEGRISK